jgi:hypothetical protein
MMVDIDVQCQFSGLIGILVPFRTLACCSHTVVPASTKEFRCHAKAFVVTRDVGYPLGAHQDGGSLAALAVATSAG